MMKSFHSNSLTTNQAGIVSITISVVFILVISLTVLGFSEVSRRNSRAALDRQLSSQAYYAAETGFNDAMSVIKSMVQTNQPLEDITKCNDPDNPYIKNNSQVRNAADQNKYTCLLVDSTLPEQTYDEVSGSVVIPLNATGPTLDTNLITWKPATNRGPNASLSRCPAKPQLPTAASWAQLCPYGIMRVDIMPVNTDTLKTPFDAAKSTMTLFLYPTDSGSTPTVTYDSITPNAYGAGAPQGRIVNAACDQTECKVAVNGLNFGSAYMRTQLLYASSQSVSVAAKSGEGLEKGQVLIDVTGRSKDVLRRLEIRASITGGVRSSSSSFADSALQSAGSICKRFVTAPSNAVNQSTRYIDYSSCPIVNN